MLQHAHGFAPAKCADLACLLAHPLKHTHPPTPPHTHITQVNIRILGGLLSAYYLSGGDELLLHKAEELAERLLPAFDTGSGVAATFVTMPDARKSRVRGHDSGTNIAEAGTASLEFTAIGRLTGRQEFADAGMQFWYALLAMENWDGLFCQGLSTGHLDCSNPKLTLGSAADSMYEYMLKQWVLSNKTQEVCACARVCACVCVCVARVCWRVCCVCVALCVPCICGRVWVGGWVRARLRDDGRATARHTQPPHTHTHTHTPHPHTPHPTQAAADAVQGRGARHAQAPRAPPL